MPLWVSTFKVEFSVTLWVETEDSATSKVVEHLNLKSKQESPKGRSITRFRWWKGMGSERWSLLMIWWVSKNLPPSNFFSPCSPARQVPLLSKFRVNRKPVRADVATLHRGLWSFLFLVVNIKLPTRDFPLDQHESSHRRRHVYAENRNSINHNPLWRRQGVQALSWELHCACNLYKSRT